MTTYTTLRGQTLDDVAYAAFGNAPAQLAPLIAANPALLRHGPVLPSGTRVILPAVDTSPVVTPMINLWD